MTAAAAGGAGRRPDDAGVTLIETLLASAAMLVALALAAGGMLTAFQLTDRIEAVTTAQSQVATALMRLDRQVRYASGIGVPRSSAGVHLVEILVTETGRRSCLQLRVSQNKLWQRRWISGASPSAATWAAVASGVSATTPFVRVPDSDQAGHQQLTIALTVRSGSAERRHSVSYTAMNTNRGSTSAVCTEGI